MGGKLFKNFSFLSATISFFILIGIFSILFLYAQDAIGEFGIDFLFNDEWEVDEDDEDLGVFGGFIPIVGTMLSTLIAMVIATPIAMGIAIFLTEIAHKSLIKPVSIAIELLAAISKYYIWNVGAFLFCSYSSIHIWRKWGKGLLKLLG